MDLEGLREASNGSAAILCYAPVAPDPAYAFPDVRDCGVVHFEEAVEEETQMNAALPPTLTTLAATHSSSPDDFYNAAVEPLDQDSILALSHYTADQANSDNWHELSIYLQTIHSYL